MRDCQFEILLSGFHKAYRFADPLHQPGVIRAGEPVSKGRLIGLSNLRAPEHLRRLDQDDLVPVERVYKIVRRVDRLDRIGATPTGYAAAVDLAALHAAYNELRRDETARAVVDSHDVRVRGQRAQPGIGGFLPRHPAHGIDRVRKQAPGDSPRLLHLTFLADDDGVFKAPRLFAGAQAVFERRPPGKLCKHFILLEPRAQSLACR